MKDFIEETCIEINTSTAGVVIDTCNCKSFFDTEKHYMTAVFYALQTKLSCDLSTYINDNNLAGKKGLKVTTTVYLYDLAE